MLPGSSEYPTSNGATTSVYQILRPVEIRVKFSMLPTPGNPDEVRRKICYRRQR